jgi:hypothetical protein
LAGIFPVNSTMKYAVLLFASLGFAVLAHAQTNAPAADQDRINITVSNDNTTTIAFKDKVFVVRSNETLDSCLKKIIPDRMRPSILLGLPDDMGEEQRRAIGVILEKFHCPVMGFQKFEPANPAVRRLVTGGH